MHAAPLRHAWRLTRVIAKRIFYMKRRNLKQPLMTYATPYIVEFVNDHRITVDHLASIINMLVETEVLSICVRAITISMSIHKYIGK